MLQRFPWSAGQARAKLPPRSQRCRARSPREDRPRMSVRLHGLSNPRLDYRLPARRRASPSTQRIPNVHEIPQKPSARRGMARWDLPLPSRTHGVATLCSVLVSQVPPMTGATATPRLGGPPRSTQCHVSTGPNGTGGSFVMVVPVCGYELKLTFAVPQPTCWIQTFWSPAMSGARSWSETITCTPLKDASLPSPAR